VIKEGYPILKNEEESCDFSYLLTQEFLNIVI